MIQIFSADGQMGPPEIVQEVLTDLKMEKIKTFADNPPLPPIALFRTFLPYKKYQRLANFSIPRVFTAL